ncbi:hypothetical protein F4802DRAFT_603362 [Xylaria palmicola]|nr:hypothetical protein F4802DRAFT_603362 [Xylaria palmicola]
MASATVPRTGVAGNDDTPTDSGKREAIRHIFRADPKNSPKVISAVFALAVLATVHALFVGTSGIISVPEAKMNESNPLTQSYPRWLALGNNA